MTGAGFQWLVLVCTDCQHVFAPDLVGEVSQTGCERCGGWTWICELSVTGPGAALPKQRTSELTGDSMGEQQ